MGHFSVEISRLPGSVLSDNQHGDSYRLGQSRARQADVSV